MSTVVQPLVSIIMPAYNAERYIADSIRSVLAQTYQNWELVVVDDGSTDDTAEVARRFAASDRRIRYFRQQNGGPGKARNAGVEKSSGPLVAFLDADDLWLREKLELQIKVAEEKEADVVFTDGFFFDGENVTDESGSNFAVVHGRFEGAEMFDLLLVRNRLPTLSVLLRREAFNQAGGFAEEYICEDYDLWLKLAKLGAVFYGMEEKLVRYRRHPASSTHRESKVLGPMAAVVRRHIDGGGLGEAEKRERLRGLYRDLIAALVEEGNLAEAGEYMKEFYAWDRGGLVTAAQRALMAALPGQFNFISRELLYRTEWHLKRIFGA
jgi:teichuronic acid biosynthesis glycosyltransferase TuaG